jgi:hypothetical protein
MKIGVSCAIARSLTALTVSCKLKALPVLHNTRNKSSYQESLKLCHESFARSAWRDSICVSFWLRPPIRRFYLSDHVLNFDCFSCGKSVPKVMWLLSFHLDTRQITRRAFQYEWDYQMESVYKTVHFKITKYFTFMNRTYTEAVLERNFRSRSIFNLEGKSRGIPQAVSRRFPTAAARVRARVRSCGICGGQSGTGAGFLRVLQFPLPVHIPPIDLQTSSIIWGR